MLNFIILSNYLLPLNLSAMKRKSILGIVIALAILIGPRASFGQIINLPPVIIRGTSVVSEKVTTAFKGQFQNAVNPRWYKLDKNYLVKFMMKDQKNHALYDKNGELIYHLSYGGAADLAKNHLDMVNTEYPGCKIITAIHAEQGSRSIWFVNVEFKNDLVLAAIEEDQLQEVSRVHSAPAK